MTTITRTELDSFVAELGGTVHGDAQSITRPDPLPSCPSWCWTDHATDGERHASPPVTFSQGSESVSVRFAQWPADEHDDGHPVVCIRTDALEEAYVPMRLAGVLAAYLGRIAAD